MNFSTICCIADLQGREKETFEFSIGEKIQVLSDKAYRRSRQNLFEAVGNVIVTQKEKAIYGEKASLSFETGDMEVLGNVRYISPDYTIYGSEFFYNLRSEQFTIKNARILSNHYTVWGKQISQVKKNEIIAREAEYTTCQDCPEAWTIFGHDVHITLGEYVRIAHALIKVKGIVVMYVPYIIFPIKKERQSGLLFPRININLDEGVTFGIPWFWAISPSRDLTLTPSVFGKRGPGVEFQYRHVLGNRKWFEFSSLHSWDRIYVVGRKEDDTVSGQQTYRHFVEYEHHFSFGPHFHHHLAFKEVNDLDIIRDFRKSLDEKILGPEIGGGAFFNWGPPSVADVTVEGYFNNTQLIPNPKAFGHHYVQILPKISLSTLPFSLRPLALDSLTLGLETDFTVFKQNHIREGAFIRNAHRFNVGPYLDWVLGNWGPILFKTRATGDAQYYRFPHEPPGQKTFSKRGILHETEISFEMSKIFNLAYKEKIPRTHLPPPAPSSEKEKKGGIDDHLIGNLPSLKGQYAKDTITITQDSYRHSQEFKLKHYFLTDQRAKGNERFFQQIDGGQGQGLFDHVDTIRSQEHLSSSNIESRIQLPLSNTIELQWNNSVIKKQARFYDFQEMTPRLRDNFTYSKLSYFNVSQGYDFTREEASSDIRDALTRLHISTGLNLGRTRFSADEYFFHQNNTHILLLKGGMRFDWGNIETNFHYNSTSTSTSTPITKLLKLKFKLTPSDLLSFSGSYDYDMAQRQLIAQEYGVLYSPLSNCWKLGVRYIHSLIDDEGSILINFLINYNENTFKELFK